MRCRLAVLILMSIGLVLTAHASVVEEPDSATSPVLIQDALPATAFAIIGERVDFTAHFSGSSASIYQWQRILNGITNEISAATNSTLTLTNLQMADNASYQLKAANATNRQAVTFTSVRPLVVGQRPTPTNNVITIFAAQTGVRGDNFKPTWILDTNQSLIAGVEPSSSSGNFSKELAGRNAKSLTAGGSLEITAAVMTGGDPTTGTNYLTCGDDFRAGSTLTYVLAGAKTGYDLNGIETYGGWLDAGRDQQAYTIYYSTVMSPELFTPLAVVNFNPPNPSNAPSATRVTLRPVTGVLAQNVAAVKFDFTRPISKNGYGGYAQIVLTGVESAREPSPDSPAPTQFGIKTDNSLIHNRLDLLGSWIWDAKTFDGQTCRLWRTFDLPVNGKITNARLLLTADNEFTVFVDGHELGRGAEWQELFDYNLLPLQLAPGRHVIAINAFNFARLAGVLLGLRIDLADGRFVEIKSDQNWKIVPNDAKGWEKTVKPHVNWADAVVVAPIGTAPWWEEPAFVNVLQAPPPEKVYFWQTAWFQITFLTLSGILLLTIFALAAQLALHQKERWLLQKERARIAMDIHDDIGSRVTQLVLNGEDAQEALPENSEVRTQLGEVWDDARKVLSSIDEILWALNPRLDTLRDFADYICDYAHKFLEPTGIDCVFEVDPHMQLAAADLPLRRSLLMAIKETLNNTVKHSAATELRLEIARQRQNLVVVVRDNGRGFDPAAVRRGGHGLGNLSRRMTELGGSCQISSQPGQGCRIEFRIPLKRPRKFSWFGK